MISSGLIFIRKAVPIILEADVIFDYILKERDYAGSVALNANHQLNRLTGNGRGTIQFFEGKSRSDSFGGGATYLFIRTGTAFVTVHELTSV